MRLRHRVFGALVILALAAAGVAGWRLWSEPAAGAQQPGRDAPVTVALAAAETRDVQIWRNGLGTVQAFQTVTIRARVDGQLDRVAFTEGQDVRQGDLLAQIDPRPFQAALDQATAQKARDEAQLANARLDLQRYESLSRDQFASRQQLDTQRATVSQYEAQVQADAASIDNARAQLSYARITAPLSGRLGVRLVDQGNLVRASDGNGIAVITQVHPVALLFTLPQDDLAAVVRRQRQALTEGQPPRPPPAGGDSGPNEPSAGGLPVQALARDGRLLAEGRLLLADNLIDQASGTARLKASFPNQDDALWPGQLVAARLLLDTLGGAVTVPAPAVQRGQDGPFAYVFKQAEGTVEMRRLRLGPFTEGIAVVEDGIAAGEQVVTDGFSRLRPGARVKPAEAQAGGGPAGKPAEGGGDRG